MSELFSPLTIKDSVFTNRIVISPMCQYLSEDGFAHDYWHLVHLGSRAVGRAALVFQEATAVSPEGRISAADMGLWKDEHIEKLKTITSFIQSQGSLAGIQLAHAGRKASVQPPWQGGKQVSTKEGGWQPIAPSPIPFREEDMLPRELTNMDIKQLVDDFKATTRRAEQAGFTVLEIHAAHGYLIHEFLSPLSNQRTDEYGGSFENRSRFLIEIVEAVRAVWPDNHPLFVRISATDWAAEGGWNIDESVKLAAILKTKGVDLVDCSSGGLVPNVKIPLEPGYQVQFAERIKRETGIMTGAVGLITEAKQAEEIIANGKADFVFIARQSLRDPNFPLTAARELGVEIDWPVQYLRAKPK